MNIKPKISICIPVYNCEKYIGDAINSILMQTYKNFELIVIDNNSTDATILEVHKFHDERIKIIKNDKNIGLLNNWNKCLDCSNGEYIKILCADDVLSTEAIEKMVNIFERYNDLGIVLNNCSEIDKNNIILKKLILKNDKNCKLPKGIDTIKNALVKNNKFSCCPSLFMIKKSVFNEVGYFESLKSGNIYSSDFEYVLRILNEFNGYIIGKPLVYIRTHNEQSGFNDKNQKVSFLYYMNEFIVYISEKNLIKFSILEKLFVDYRLCKDGLVESFKKINNNNYKNLKNDLSYIIKEFSVFSFICAILVIFFSIIPKKIALTLYTKHIKRKKI